MMWRGSVRFPLSRALPERAFESVAHDKGGSEKWPKRRFMPPSRYRRIMSASGVLGLRQLLHQPVAVRILAAEKREHEWQWRPNLAQEEKLPPPAPSDDHAR